ncbi:MAG: hypothetical protein ACRDOI_32210 [Trebonia sp.]
MTVTVTEARAEAVRPAAELGCEVDAHLLRPGVVVASNPTRGV